MITFSFSSTQHSHCAWKHAVNRLRRPVRRPNSRKGTSLAVQMRQLLLCFSYACSLNIAYQGLGKYLNLHCNFVHLTNCVKWKHKGESVACFFYLKWLNGFKLKGALGLKIKSCWVRPGLCPPRMGKDRNPHLDGNTQNWGFPSCSDYGMAVMMTMANRSDIHHKVESEPRCSLVSHKYTKTLPCQRRDKVKAKGKICTGPDWNRNQDFSNIVHMCL